MSKFDEDKEMVDGIVELLLRVKDLDNRREMVIATLRDFDEQGVIYNRKDFLNRVGVSLGDEKMSSCSHFSDDEDIMPFFRTHGVPANEYDIVERFEIEFNNNGQPIEFATEIQEIQREILSFLVENPLATAVVIAKTLELEIAAVLNALGILQEAGLLVLENSTITISPIGKKVSKAIKIPQAKIKYRYEERPNAPALKQGGESRDFCANLMSINRLYSREEIDLLRNGMKSSYSDVADVWLARGGWYRPKGTTTSLPYCRHIWNQVIVRKKK